MKNIANLRISYELFRDMFHLPDDTNIISVSIDNKYWGDLVVTIESAELPEVNEGDRIPDAAPLYTRTIGENGEVIKVERTGWGIK